LVYQYLCEEFFVHQHVCLLMCLLCVIVPYKIVENLRCPVTKCKKIWNTLDSCREEIVGTPVFRTHMQTHTSTHANTHIKCMSFYSKSHLQCMQTIVHTLNYIHLFFISWDYSNNIGSQMKGSLEKWMQTTQKPNTPHQNRMCVPFSPQHTAHTHSLPPHPSPLTRVESLYKAHPDKERLLWKWMHARSTRSSSLLRAQRQNFPKNSTKNRTPPNNFSSHTVVDHWIDGFHTICSDLLWLGFAEHSFFVFFCYFALTHRTHITHTHTT